MELNWTPTEGRIIELLSDGQGHTMEELLRCIEDDQATPPNVHTHLSHIRRVLRMVGKNITCLSHGSGNRLYHLVRVMASPYDGRK